MHTSVSDDEWAWLNAVVHYNHDVWDGYGCEREVIFNTAQNLDSNLVVLAGDTQNVWTNNLHTQSDGASGLQQHQYRLQCFEDFLTLDANAALQFEGKLSFLIDEIQYTSFHNRGLMLVTFAPQERNIGRGTERLVWWKEYGERLNKEYSGHDEGRIPIFGKRSY